MRKIYFGVGLAIALTIILSIIGYNSTYATYYQIDEAGYTYDEQGQLIKFNKDSKYTIDNLKSSPILVTDNQKIELEKSKILYLNNGEMQNLNKNVLIVSNDQIDEIPSKSAYVGNTQTGYKVITNNNQGDQTIPLGSIVKLYEKSYLILDKSILTNEQNYEKKISENSIISIDENQKTRILSNQTKEEIANDKLKLKLENNQCVFNIEEEYLECQDKAKSIDLRSIKVEMDENAVERATKIETTSPTPNEQQTPSEQNNSNQLPNTQQTNPNQQQENNQTQQENNTNIPNQNNQPSEQNPQTEEEIKKIEEELKKTQEKYQFKVPVIGVNFEQKQTNIELKGTIFDSDRRLTALKTNIYDANQQLIYSEDIDYNLIDFIFTYDKLEYFEKYQVTIEGKYKNINGIEEAVTFYRKNITVESIQIDAEVINQKTNELTLKISAADVPSNLTELSFAYELNTYGETEIKYIAVDVDELRQNGFVELKIENLEPNSVYTIEIDKMIVNEENVKNESWYRVVQTAKRQASLKNIEITYSFVENSISIVPRDLLDPDDTIKSINYVLYNKEDYAQNKEQAKQYANYSVPGDQKYSAIKIFRNEMIIEGEYIVVAYIYGNDFVTDYQLTTPESNSLVIGLKTAPTAQIKVTEIGAPYINFQYQIFDLDQAIFENNFTQPILEIYELNEANEMETSPIFVQKIPSEILNSLDKLGNAQFLGLKSNTRYKIVVRSSYALGESSATNYDQIIGVSEQITTQETEDVVVSFTSEEITTSEITVNIKFTNPEYQIEKMYLRKAKLQVYENDNVTTVGAPIILDEQMLSLTSPAGATVKISNLKNNTNYVFKIIDLFDVGQNNITSIGKASIKTLKITPIATSVLTSYISDKAQLNAIINDETTNNIINDPDSALEKISYKIYDEVNLTKPLKIIEKSAINQSEQAIFNLFDPELGRGRNYIVKAEIVYNDGLMQQKYELTSIVNSVKKEKPKVVYTFLSKTEQTIEMLIEIIDPENTIYNNSMIVESNGTILNLRAGVNNIQLPIAINNTQSVQVSGEYKLNINDTPVFEIFNQATIAGFNSYQPNLTTTINYNNRKLTSNVNAQANDYLNTLEVDYSLFNGTEVESSFNLKQNNDEIYKPITMDVPLKNIYLGNNYDLTEKTKITYIENNFNYTNFTGIVYISNSSYTNFMKSTFGEISPTVNLKEITPYVIEQATVDQFTGDLTNVILKNYYTNTYLAKSTTLEDKSTTATPINFKKQINGSYKLVIDQTYYNLETGIFGDEISATELMMYSVNQKELTNTSPVNIPGLSEPIIKAKQTEIYDKYVKFDIDITDNDGTFVKLTDGSRDVFLEIIANGQETVARYQLTNAKYQGLVIDNLKPTTNYEFKIIGKYNLQNGAGEIYKEFVKGTFITKAALPTVIASTYNWSPACGVRTTSANINYTDESNVITDIEYIWYEDQGINYTPNNLGQMNNELSKLNPTTAYYNTSKSFNMSMYDGPQRYYSSKTYIIAIFIKTNLLETPRFLANVNKITITPPQIAANLTNTNLTSTSASFLFNFNDPSGYLTCAVPKTFNYKLVDTTTNTFLEQNKFTSNQVSGSWSIDFKNLAPNRKYRLEITSTFDDLNGLGLRTWYIDSVGTTLAEYVKSNSPIMNYNSTTKQSITSASQLTQGSSEIKDIKMLLYNYQDYGTSTEKKVLVDTKSITLPATYPATVQANFDLTARTAGYYYTTLIVTYYIPETGETRTYEKDSLAIYHTSALLRGTKMNVEENQLAIEAQDINQDQQYTLTVLDQDAKPVLIEKVEGNELIEYSNNLAFDSQVYYVSIVDENNELIDSQTINNQMENLVTIMETNEGKIYLKGENFNPNITTVKVTLKEKAQNIFDTISDFLGFNSIIEYEITLEELLNGKLLTEEFSKYEITVTNLEETIPVNVKIIERIAIVNE